MKTSIPSRKLRSPWAAVVRVIASAWLLAVLAGRSLADGGATFTVTEQVGLDWWAPWYSCDGGGTWGCSFVETHGDDGSFVASGTCNGSEPVFRIEWEPNAARAGAWIATREEWFSRGSACIPACGCEPCLRYTGGGWSWQVKIESRVPFWCGLSEPIGYMQSEPITQWNIGLGQLPYGDALYEIRFTACREDLDASGEVDSADVGLMLLFWGCVSCDVPDRFDLDASQGIDGADLALLLLSSGTCVW